MFLLYSVHCFNMFHRCSSFLFVLYRFLICFPVFHILICLLVSYVLMLFIMFFTVSTFFRPRPPASTRALAGAARAPAASPHPPPALGPCARSPASHRPLIPFRRALAGAQPSAWTRRQGPDRQGPDKHGPTFKQQTFVGRPVKQTILHVDL